MLTTSLSIFSGNYVSEKRSFVFKNTEDFAGIRNIPIILIVNKESQEQNYKEVFSHPDIEVLYKGPLCVNATLGHGTKPRNYVVIVKIKDPTVPAV